MSDSKNCAGFLADKYANHFALTLRKFQVIIAFRNSHRISIESLSLNHQCLSAYINWSFAPWHTFLCKYLLANLGLYFRDFATDFPETSQVN